MNTSNSNTKITPRPIAASAHSSGQAFGRPLDEWRSAWKMIEESIGLLKSSTCGWKFR